MSRSALGDITRGGVGAAMKTTTSTRRVPASLRHAPAAPLGWITILLFAVGGLTVVSHQAVAATCEPIVYTFRGSPPATALAELGLAVAELNRRSGIVFAEGTPSAARLVITWSDQGITHFGSAPAASRANTHALGSATSRWQQALGHRTLVDALVEIDARAQWPMGLARGDGLAAVMLHELGHVLGLHHSTEPASFMYPQVSHDPRQWPERDLQRLAGIGRDLGCRPTGAQ